MNFKRGQAAMEYLMTYGWAILVIVIVLAALLYLGLFNPPTPEVCIMPSGVNCQKAYLHGETGTTVSTLDITLVNGLQKSIVVTHLACTQNPEYYGDDADVTDATIPMGGSATFTGVECTDSAATPAGVTVGAGEMYSGKVNMQYYFKDEGSGAPRRLTGTLTAKGGA